MTTVLLDTHVLYWWAAMPRRISAAGTRAIDGADELAVADVSWFELAYLAEQGRIVLDRPALTWMSSVTDYVRSIPITPSIAAAAVALPTTFPGDPVDRLIYATAVQNGWPLVTKDARLRGHRHPRKVTIW